MIIDAHAHVWPEQVARQVLAARPAGLTAMADGTLDGLRRTMDAAGIDRACCLGVAHVAKNVQRTNEFIGAVDRSRFIPFGTVHPGLSVEQNLKSLHDNGLAAVKFHPIFQGLALADPLVREIFTALADEGIVVLTHAGAGGDEAATRRGSPAEVLAVADAIPGLRLIACHYGGYHLLDAAEPVLVGSRVVLETSWPPSMATLDAERIRSIIERHGAARFVFGSDWPMAEPGREIAVIRGLGLTAGEQDAVLGGTLARLLGIDGIHDSEGSS
jgi:predicted TIM-barrel fold metal-dependent hydrolase